MSEIKAIETFYNGYRFRSRLEARWAVFFDSARIKYQYEPEGFKLSTGEYYLPDFYLPDVESRHGKGLWCDVKSGKPYEDLSKVEQFAKDGNQVAILYPFDGNHENVYLYPGEGEDFPFYFTKCPHCGVVTYEYPNNYGHHINGCDSKYIAYKKMANEIRGYVIKESVNKENIDCNMDDVDEIVRGLYIFETKYHVHEDNLRYAVLKAKQARFEYGECG